MEQSERDVDVVVLGSGAAGLTAAVAAAVEGARVALFEKSALLGGTTALSGAGIWLPANPQARAAGVEDSPEQAVRYLLGHANGTVLPELAEALVAGVPDYLDLLERHTEIRLHLMPGWPDYHPEYPGGLPGGGRTMEPGLVSLRGLGPWHDRIVGEPRRLRGIDTPIGGGSGRLDGAESRRREDEELEAGGRALVAGLVKAALRLGVDIAAESRAVRLLREGAEVTGVELETPSGSRSVTAGAVIVATGGFEYDAALSRDFLRGPFSRPLGVPTNTGDGLRMAMRVGAQLGNMREAWWCPVVNQTGVRPDGQRRGLLLVRESALAGSVMVNRAGRRFMNEATNYNAYGGAFHQIDASTLSYPNIPAVMIFDQRTVDVFGVFGGEPGEPVPDWVVTADSLAAVAGRFGLPVEQLHATIERFNAAARDGRDDDFGRGRSAYDRFPGGRTLDPASPASTLAPLEHPPFHAVEVVPSVLGTKGGPRTDTAGRVLDVDGAVIPGLYAAGNAMAHPSGMVYGGAGGTLNVAGIWGMYTGRAAVHDRQADGVRSQEPTLASTRSPA